MHTARLLTISQHALRRGCLLHEGVPASGGVSAFRGGACFRGVSTSGGCLLRGVSASWWVVSQHALRQTPLWTEFLLKILPCPKLCLRVVKMYLLQSESFRVNGVFGWSWKDFEGQMSPQLCSCSRNQILNYNVIHNTKYQPKTQSPKSWPNFHFWVGGGGCPT